MIKNFDEDEIICTRPCDLQIFSLIWIFFGRILNDFEAEIGQCGAHLGSLEGDLHKIDTKLTQKSSKKTHQLIFVEIFQIKSNFPRKISVPLKLCTKFTFTDHRLISAYLYFLYFFEELDFCVAL
jgi:hypothetical protein